MKVIYLILKYYGKKLPSSQSDIDQYEAYYQAAGGERREEVYGLGSEAKTYYGKNLCKSNDFLKNS